VATLAFVSIASGAAAVCIDYDAHPHMVSSVPTASGGYGVAVDRGYAFVTSGGALEVFDVSDPQRPSQVAALGLPCSGADVVIAGKYAYVADLYAGVLAVDIEDPIHPFIAGTAGTYGAAAGLSRVGDLLYVSTLANSMPLSKLEVLSIAPDPASPVVLGMENVPDWGFDVAVSGSQAYVACSHAGVAVLDVSDPCQPTLMGTADTPDLAVGVEARDGYAYVADQLSIQIVDARDPEQPVVVGQVAVPGVASAITARGSVLYVGDYADGLLLVDKLDPKRPRIIGQVPLPGVTYVTALEEDLAYVVAWNSLQIVSLGIDPANVGMVTLDTPGCADGIAVQGSYAYIADGTAGLEVALVGGVLVPRLLGRVALGGWAQDVVVRGTRAYVADGENGFCVVDVSRPASPVQVGHVPLSGYAFQVALPAGLPQSSPIAEYAYVTDWDGLRVIDLTGEEPVLRASLQTGGEVKSVAVLGDRAYLADADLGLLVVDVADPLQPHWLGTLTFPEEVSTVALHGDQPCVLHGDRLSVVDASDPAHPAVLGTVGVRRGMFVTVSGDHAYVDALAWGVVVVDLSDATAPRVVGQLDTRGYAYDCVIQGCGLYVADQISGIELAPAQVSVASREADVEPGEAAPLGLVLQPPFPNPARNGSILRFTNAAAGRIDLQILDPAGRGVRSLTSRVLAPGEHVVAWDGRDDHGRPVPGGTYFVRLRYGEAAAMRRLIRLR